MQQQREDSRLRWRRLLKLPFYKHLLPFFNLLRHRPLEIDDLGTPGELASSKPTVAALHQQFGDDFSKLRDEEHLIRVLETAAWDTTTTLAYTFGVLNTVFMYAPAVIVRLLTGVAEGSQSMPSTWLWVLAALLFVLGTASAVLHSHSTRYIYQYGARKKGALTILILQKLLTLNQIARQELSDGAIVNMMHSDSETFFRTAPGFMEAMFGVVQLILGIGLLAFQVGFVPAAASLCVLLVLPIPKYLFTHMANLRRKYLQAEDWRAKLTHEILCNIRAIKLYAWDLAMLRKLLLCRVPELQYVHSIGLATALGFMVVVAVAPGIQHASIFYSLLLNSSDGISTSHIITAMAILAVMRGPLYELPSMWAQVTAVQVAAERLVRFFKMPSERSVPQHHPSPRSDGVMLSCTDAAFGWSRLHELKHPHETEEGPVSNILHKLPEKELDSAIIHGLNLEIRQGQLVGIVGGMGAGKSTLLRGILGEVTLLRGSVEVRGSVAYCAQHPYMPSGSLRACILGGLPFDGPRYEEVLRVCALDDDMHALPHRDSTIIAGMGRNLSGGQRARIALARAIYRDADVYILDDPLASLDSSVRIFVFQRCFQSFLRGKTIITIIRDQRQLRHCDLLVALRKQTTPFVGSFEQFTANHFVMEDFGVDVLKDYDEMLEQGDALGWHKNVLHQFAGVGSVAEGSLMTPLLSSQLSHTGGNYDDVRSTMLFSFADVGRPSMMPTLARQFSTRQSLLELQATNRMTTTIEGIETDGDAPRIAQALGAVSREVYLEYVRAMGTWRFGGLLIMLLLWYLFDAASYFWLIHWTREVYGHDDDERRYDDIMYIHAYAGLVGCAILCSAIASTIFPALHASAAQVLFEKLATCALLGQLSILEKIGGNELLAVLTRFVSEMDLEVPGILYECISTGFVVLVSIFGLIYSTTGLALVFIVPVGVVIWRKIGNFKTCTTGMQRVEAKTQVVIYQHYAECLLGAATIRAHRIIPATLAALERHVQMNNYACSFKTGAVNFFTIRLQAVGSLCCTMLAFLALTLRDAHSGDMMFWAAIPICLTMTSNFKSLVRLICAADANMQSIETIVDYSDIPYETDADHADDHHGSEIAGRMSRRSTRLGSMHTDSIASSKDMNDPRPISTSRSISTAARSSTKPFWPDKGSIKASSLTIGYGTAPVLRDLAFTIKPMQKVALVGRTGVGKSTLFSAFFGAADILDGMIVIDGKDITTLPVRRLRSSLSLIPQTAILFSFSVRDNLDIDGEHSDLRLWDVLDQVGLGEMVRSLPGGLAYSFRTGAGTDLWSSGQKQLLCIARTLLRPSRVIFLDEATSSVGDDSDSKIMRVIDDCFAHCTVVACVHRLNNIMMYDRVLVLDKGKMVEFDKPQTLINREGSVLRELWKAQQHD